MTAAVARVPDELGAPAPSSAARALMTPDDVIAELGVRGLLELVELAARRCGATVDEIASRKKTKSVVRARQAAWAVQRIDRPFSYPELAAIWNRDQASVRSGVRAADATLVFELLVAARARVVGPEEARDLARAIADLTRAPFPEASLPGHLRALLVWNP